MNNFIKNGSLLSNITGKQNVVKQTYEYSKKFVIKLISRKIWVVAVEENFPNFYIWVHNVEI